MKSKTNLTPEQSYSEIEKMLYKLAHSAVAQYQIPFEDALSECNWVYMRAVSGGYQPDRGMMLSSYVYQKVKWHFLTQSHRRGKIPLTEELNEQTAGLATPVFSPCLEVVDGFSQEASEVVALLLETPNELCEIIGAQIKTPKQLLGIVKNHLFSKGWNKEKWDDVHEEIQQAFQMVWSH